MSENEKSWYKRLEKIIQSWNGENDYNEKRIKRNVLKEDK